MCRGYNHFFLDLPKTQLSREIVKSYQAQVSRKDFAILLKSQNQQTLSFYDFKKDEGFLYFKRGPKFWT